MTTSTSSLFACNRLLTTILVNELNENFLDINFKELAKKRTHGVRYPTRVQRKQHIDFILMGRCPRTKKSTSVTIDLKTYKRSKRAKNNDAWQWLELRSAEGRPGWVYGEADFVVFETRNSFILVSRSNLAKWAVVSSNINFSSFVSNPWDAKYKLYTRPKKKEELVQVRTKDLLDIKGSTEWQKF